MKNKYNIIDLIFEINTPFYYVESKNFKEFLDCNPDKNLKKIKINVTYIDKIKKTSLENISNMPLINIYENESFFRYDFLKEPNGLPYAYSLFYKNQKNNIDIYIERSCNYIKNTLDVFEIIMFEKILSLNDIIVLHASYIKYNEKSILFTAPSGTGKSTQADLWQKYENAEIINGDKVALKKDNGIWYAYGLPYAGSSNIFKNIKSDISSIVILRQGKENKIEKISLSEAFKKIYSEITINTWDKDFVEKAVDLTLDLVNQVPIYLLTCLPNEDAVKLLKEKIEGNI